jgi:uncharacterized protein YjiS (DUF1127 family)
MMNLDLLLSTAHVARNDGSLLRSNSFSHYFDDDSDHLVQPEPQRANLFGRIGAAFRWLAEMPRRSAVLNELGSLSEHELADIGLTRSDLPRVFDPNFAAQHNRDRLGQGSI